MSQSETADWEGILAARARVRKLFEKRPSAAKGDGRTTTRMVKGMFCESSEGPWRLTVDQPEAMGGSGQAPSPGFVGRAALGACLVQGYALALAGAGIAVESLEVEVSGTSDGRGFLGVPDVPPGYADVTCRVSVKADASQADIEALLDKAEKESPWLNNLTGSVPMNREVMLL